MKEIRVFKTSDGTIHDTKEDAERYEIDLVATLIDNRLSPLLGRLGRSDTLMVIQMIIGDNHKDLVGLMCKINSILSFCAEDQV